VLALIMAGGEGSRLNLGEKPLVPVGGQPMIARVIDAFRSSGCEVVVVASPRTPMTRNWCRVEALDIITAAGTGYIEDMVSAVTLLGETGALFVSACDLPCLNAGIIRKVIGQYRNAGKDACSVWVPISLFRSPRDIQYTGKVDGTDACPAGLNILRGDLIGGLQEEFRLLLKEPRLAYNINTRGDLDHINALFNRSRSRASSPV